MQITTHMDTFVLVIDAESELTTTKEHSESVQGVPTGNSIEPIAALYSLLILYIIKTSASLHSNHRSINN